MNPIKYPYKANPSYFIMLIILCAVLGIALLYQVITNDSGFEIFPNVLIPRIPTIILCLAGAAFFLRTGYKSFQVYQNSLKVQQEIVLDEYGISIPKPGFKGESETILYKDIAKLKMLHYRGGKSLTIVDKERQQTMISYAILPQLYMLNEIIAELERRTQLKAV
ncbi:MAG: hypothetical protein MRZ79_27785 [Bacteroidia bacterium]|nr:hypothetical protein [Bacteroidia bacterium]